LYDSFYKAIIGEGVWKERCKDNTRRLSTMIAEAYTLAMVHNHYFVWLYEFKANNPSTSIKTAYDHQVSEPTNEGDELLIEMFCGDLDLVEVSVPTQQQTNNDSSTDMEEKDQGTVAAGLLEFKLLLEEGETADTYKESKDHDQWILKAIQEQIDLEQQGTRDKAHYSKMNAILTTDTENHAYMDLRDQRKRKRQSKASLTDFTSSTKKSKKGSDEIKGWTNAGKQYVMEMLKEIKQDEDSGIHKKWDRMYKTLCNTVKDSKEKDEDEAESEQYFAVDPSILYGEVLSVSV
jgi:hypothetical protein